MAVYVIAHIAVEDPEAYGEYQRHGLPTIAAAGGRVIARGAGVPATRRVSRLPDGPRHGDPGGRFPPIRSARPDAPGERPRRGRGGRRPLGPAAPLGGGARRPGRRAAVRLSRRRRPPPRRW